MHWLIQQKCEQHTPAPDPGLFFLLGARVGHGAGIPCRGNSPGTALAAARSTRHTEPAQPEQLEHLVAVKVRLGHWQALPELENVLGHKGKEEGERREKWGRKRRGKVLLLIPQVERAVR